MKSKYLFGLVIILLFFTVLFGCRSSPPPLPPPIEEPLFEFSEWDEDSVYEDYVYIQDSVDSSGPLTPTIFYRLVEENIIPQRINEITFLISGDIMLERVDFARADRIEEGRRVRLEDISNVVSISILDHAEALSSSIEILDEEIVISVSFEHDDSYRLSFSAPVGAPSSISYFTLKYSPFENEAENDYEKGRIMYGENEYTLRYIGETPHLLIDVSYQETVNRNPRIIPGRSRR